MKVFFNIIIIQTVLNLYLIFKGWRVIPPRFPILRRSFIAFFALEVIFYLIGCIWYDSLSVGFSRVLLHFCTFWSFFVLYLSLILLLIDLLRLIVRFAARIFKKKITTSFSLRFQRTTLLFASIFTVLLLSWGYYKFMHPSINHRNIVIEKEIGSPMPKPLRIVMFSDLHLGYLNDKKILRTYVDKIMEQKPDLILIGGDIIDFSLRPLLDDNIAEELNRMKPPLGVYACLGNHDHYVDEENKIKWLKEKSGITILQDSVAFVDSTLYIVGREDFRSPRKGLKELLVDVDNNSPIFVLNHQPNNFSDEIEANIDLALYGHTHDGQIIPLTWILRSFYELSAGYEYRKNTHIFVSSGLGGIPQLRIGSESEIIVVDCIFSKKIK